MKQPTLGSRLNSVGVHLGRALRRSSVGGDLTPEQRSILSFLVFGGPARMSTIATMEQVSPPAITRTVALLERRGLVRRARDLRDARATLITTTAKGERLVIRGRDERARRVDAALKALPAASVGRIGAAIDDLEELVRGLGGPGGR